MTRTNLITGFLGSGKTTSILHLLAHKDPNEKWAVLVNEFGEVGIDGALLADSGALLKEIPGGCMCCVNGLPMQVGLNTLLRQGKPDRLLIEPTGLGHPKQILDLLTAPVYEPWIDLRATLCILDPRLLLVIAGFPATFISMFFTGSLLIEVMFSLNGLGLLGYEATVSRDYPVMFGTLYIFTLIGLLLNIVSDISYTLVDPRIDFEGR